LGEADNEAERCANVVADWSARDYEGQNPPGCNPDEQEQADCTEGTNAHALSIGGDVDLSPIPKAHEDGQQGAPAKPLQGRKGHVLKHLRLGAGVHLLHEWNVYQIEKVEQADPGDTGQQVNPT